MHHTERPSRARPGPPWVALPTGCPLHVLGPWAWPTPHSGEPQDQAPAGLPREGQRNNQAPRVPGLAWLSPWGFLSRAAPEEAARWSGQAPRAPNLCKLPAVPISLSLPQSQRTPRGPGCPHCRAPAHLPSEGTESCLPTCSRSQPQHRPSHAHTRARTLMCTHVGPQPDPASWAPTPQHSPGFPPHARAPPTPEMVSQPCSHPFHALPPLPA